MNKGIFKKKANTTQRTIVLLDDSTPFAVKEAYKAARTNLMFMFAEHEHKCVSVTSSFPGEGKTTTCANLAISFAQTGAKTLIIDGDLRKPRMHRMFSISSAPGITDVLGGFAKLEDAIYTTKYENLFVIPAGTIPPNPAELLASQSMKQLLEKLSGVYGFEYVFIDTPPINMVTDAAVVSQSLVGSIVVVKSGETNKESLKSAVLALEQAGTNILGFILNDVSLDRYSYKYGRGNAYQKDYQYGYCNDEPGK
ncbi:MAG: CpsD/CapB family tyrosine-protein kinase [Ruminococcaceae bacterium]|nr:CpsD/CapB family tyrosine-protein kinase [Oscillospiraceae bacterium]